MTASAHVLVFRPLIGLLRERGDEVEISARDYAQTLQLLELHGLDATVIGRHGGRSPDDQLRCKWESYHFFALRFDGHIHNKQSEPIHKSEFLYGEL